jgi:hypothetical protein
MSEWEPAETVPRDGTWILGCYADRPRVVRWRSGRGHRDNYAGGIVYFWSDGYFRHGEPLGWQPLPAAKLAA